MLITTAGSYIMPMRVVNQEEFERVFSLAHVTSLDNSGQNACLYSVKDEGRQSCETTPIRMILTQLICIGALTAAHETYTENIAWFLPQNARFHAKNWIIYIADHLFCAMYITKRNIWCFKTELTARLDLWKFGDDLWKDRCSGPGTRQRCMQRTMRRLTQAGSVCAKLISAFCRWFLTTWYPLPCLLSSNYNAWIYHLIDRVYCILTT